MIESHQRIIDSTIFKGKRKLLSDLLFNNNTIAAKKSIYAYICDVHKTFETFAPLYTRIRKINCYNSTYENQLCDLERRLLRKSNNIIQFRIRPSDNHIMQLLYLKVLSVKLNLAINQETRYNLLNTRYQNFYGLPRFGIQYFGRHITYFLFIWL